MKEQMNKRLRRLRKELKLSQQEFSASLGMKQGGYSHIESGENSLTDKNITLICLRYSVSEQWLRTGEGEMFTLDNGLTEKERRLLEQFRQLTESFKDFMLMTLENLREQQRKEKASPEDTPKNADSA